MKKFALYTFLSLSSALIAADGVRYEVEPTIGYNNFDSSSKMESTFMYGIRGTIHSNDYYGYRLSYQRSDGVHYSKSTSIKQKTTDVQRISGQVLMNGEEEYNVVPYVLLGLGYESLSDETSNDVSQGYVEGGIGFKYNMYDNIFVNLEGQVLKKFDTDDIDYGINLGLGYMLGYRVNKPAVYQVGALDEIPVVDNVLPMRQNSTTQRVVTPVQESDSRYTFNEERTQYIPEIANTPVAPAPIVVPNSVVSSSVSPVNNYQPLSSNLYYIQMAAWSKFSDDKLLSRLENSGFSYDIENAVRRGKDVQLLKVGPYEQYADAKAALRDLKKIKKDAYITKIK